MSDGLAGTPVVYFRSDGGRDNEEEFAACSRFFPTFRHRTDVPPGSLVIARYSSLPYRHDLDYDLRKLGSRLANDERGHSWITEFDWYQDLKWATPQSWFERDFPYSDHPGPFVVKGRTNSRKRAWSTSMFAADRKAAVAVALELAKDDMISQQGLVYREYVPLVTFETDFTGLPITNEWRFFYWRTTELGHGYYWSSATDEAKAKARIDDDGRRLARRVARVAAEHLTWFVVDVAEKASGGWMLVEINGEMSGPAEIPYESLYAAWREAVDRERIIDLCDVCGVPEGEAHWYRAGGDVPCEICGKLYYDHEMDDRHVGNDGTRIFHLICDGSLVKT
jgi:hypothetical protein